MKMTKIELEVILEQMEEMQENISNILDVIYYIVDKTLIEEEE